MIDCGRKAMDLEGHNQNGIGAILHAPAGLTSQDKTAELFTGDQ